MSNRRTVFIGLFKRFRWVPLVAAGAMVSLLLPAPGAAQNRIVPEGIGTKSGGACSNGAAIAAVLLPGATAPTSTPTVAPPTASAPSTARFTWSYKIIAFNANGDGIPSPANANTADGAGTLDANNYNTITWTGITNPNPVVYPVLGYRIERTAVGTSPSTVGIIASIPAAGPLSFVDNGVAATPYVESLTNPAAVPSSSSFVLTATTGYISTPDGNAIFMWGYANGNGSFQYPGPVLCVNQGDIVNITLKNSLPVASSLIFPGLTGVKVDGQAQSLDVSVGTNDSLSKPAPSGTAVTYQFSADDPGTFLYESGTNPELQVRMGMVGALIVRPTQIATLYNLYVQDTTSTVANPCATDPILMNPEIKSRVLSGELNVGFVYNDCSSAFNGANEYMHLLSEVDPHMHHAIELATCQTSLQGGLDPVTGQPVIPCTPDANPTYDMTKYLPRYFMINGRSFPDTITPNFSSAIPTQPYGSLVHVMPSSTAVTAGHSVTQPDDFNPLPATVRFLNGGPVNYPFHPHSNHDQTIAVDGRMLINNLGATPVSTSVDRFSVVVAPGQTTDQLFEWKDAQKWDPTSNPVGVTIPGPQNRADGSYWSGSPYLGVKLPLLNGITQWNQCGEYYHFAHSHDLVHVTNYGSPGGGMLTLIRVDPPPSLQSRYQTSCDGGPGWN